MLCLIISQSLNYTDAFVAPTAFSARTRITNVGGAFDHTPSLSRLHVLPIEDVVSQCSSIVISSEAADAAAEASLKSLQTFFVASGALLFGAIGLYVVTGAIIVPKAARQLEKDTKRLRPGLWESYVEKAELRDSETMTDRPQLLEELGETMRPLILADFETQANKK